MMAPFAPHLAEELWRRLGHDESLAYEAFPVADPALLVADSVTYPVQVNGKVRGRIEVAPDTAEAEVRAAALAEVAAALDGREPKKVIVVPGRMVSIVVCSRTSHSAATTGSGRGRLRPARSCWRNVGVPRRGVAGRGRVLGTTTGRRLPCRP